MVKKKQLEKLLERDQLRMVMRDGQAFAELNENAITFPPTYKYEFESQAFDLKWVTENRIVFHTISSIAYMCFLNFLDTQT